MFEGLVASILNKWLGKYVEDLDTEHLNVGIFSGEVRLNDLRLKPEALVSYKCYFPLDKQSPFETEGGGNCSGVG